MKILVVEDEPLFADAILMMLDELSYENVKITDNATDALQLFVSFEPDVVLMDIKIKGEKDGIAVADSISQAKKPSPVIFMTSMDDKNTFERAKQTNPIAYLIKPFDEGTLERSIELAVYKHYKATWDTDLFTDWQQDILIDDSIFVKVGGRLERIYIRDIVHLRAETKYVELYVKNQKILLRMSLNELTRKLPVQYFVRIRRNQIINTQFIANIDLDNDLIFLLTGEQVNIGRSYRDELLDRLKIVH